MNFHMSDGSLVGISTSAIVGSSTADYLYNHPEATSSAISAYLTDNPAPTGPTGPTGAAGRGLQGQLVLQGLPGRWVLQGLGLQGQRVLRV